MTSKQFEIDAKLLDEKLFQIPAYNIINKVKCGEIFYDENQKIIFQCLLCGVTIESECSQVIVEHFTTHLNDAVLKEENGDEFVDNLQLQKVEEYYDKEETHSHTSIENDFEDKVYYEEDIPIAQLIETKSLKQDLNDLSDPTITEKSTTVHVKLPVVEKSIKDNMYHCPFQDCGKTKKTDLLIRVHMRNIHVLEHQIQSNGRYQCPVCDSSFRRKDNLLAHVQNIHKLLSGVNIDPSPVDSKYHCPICDLIRGKLHTLNTHLRVQHEDYFTKLLDEQQSKLIPLRKRRKGYSKICEMCGKVLSSASFLRDHIATHTGARPHKCNYCDKSFNNKSNWRDHMRIHTSTKNYKCNFCDKRFIRSSEKTNHELRNHLKEKRFECKICSKKFYTRTLLKNHNLRHTGERPYTCKICSRAFFDGTSLKGHMVSHSDAKDYECDICNAKFSRKKNLVAHKQTHSTVKKYNCEVCGQRFAQCAGLYSHKKTHHKELVKKKHEI